MLAEACLALNIYWEARNQPEIGQRAVAEVVLNRVHHKHYPNEVCEVVYQTRKIEERTACQFSWFCDGKSDKPKNIEAWNRAQYIAGVVLEEYETNSVLPKTVIYYHNTDVSPFWARTKKLVKQIGNHLFYSD